ncbi:McrB family protein [Endozoicomonas sp. 2B-B]
MKIKQGVVLGEGGRSLTIEKINAENIYIRMAQGNQLRIIPVIVVGALLKALETGKITLRDIDRTYRKEHDLPPLFDYLHIDFDKYILGYDSTIKRICEYELSAVEPAEVSENNRLNLPKPFLLLAGISGTGKSRFIRKQAEFHDPDDPEGNFCLIPVRPDWHEPSDLLGYVSRVDKPKYIATKVLAFIIRAWKSVAPDASAAGTGTLNSASPPYWLCLDEMNLAPVEQYFADYLSVLETRDFNEVGEYCCEPLLDLQALNQSGDLELQADLGLMDDPLWGYFQQHGIGIPPNLLVAGTVNMDETTHGFSRKVIDRALTLDYGEFYPNDYGQFFEGQPENRVFHWSVLTSARREQLTGTFDTDGKRTVAFLERVNQVLKRTPFELAYRALNELLLYVACLQPGDEQALQAVWDDFMMTKVLPRIDGDEDKLRVVIDEDAVNLLDKLTDELKGLLPDIWDGQRPDLFRDVEKGIPCRSRKKLEWMKARLESHTFTSYWP